MSERDRKADATSPLRDWKLAFLGSVLSDGACRTLCAIEAHMSTETGKCWPSHATLARCTGQHVRTVKKHVAAARDAMLLEIHTSKGQIANGGATNLYLVPARFFGSVQVGDPVIAPAKVVSVRSPPQVSVGAPPQVSVGSPGVPAEVKGGAPTVPKVVPARAPELLRTSITSRSARAPARDGAAAPRQDPDPDQRAERLRKARKYIEAVPGVSIDRLARMFSLLPTELEELRAGGAK